MTSAATPSFRLLGPLEAAVGERKLPVGGARQRALLALLLLHPNEVIGRDRLIDELWRDHAPESAANALAALVVRLRRILPAETVVTRSGGYVAQVAPEQIDVFRFERLQRDGQRALASGEAAAAAELLRAALAEWRGPALGDLQYEPFAASTVLQLEELRLTAIEGRLDADLALGRHADIVGELQSLVREQPLRERLRAQLMLALYASERQAEALEVYRETRAFLLDELGIDPSAALQQLHQAILNQDAAILPAATSAAPADTAAPAAAARPVTSLAAGVVDPAVLDDRLTRAEADALLEECASLIARAVESYGGTVHSRRRSEVRGSFGLEVVRRDDPDRAALAALQILETATAFTSDVEAAWEIAGLAVTVGVELGWTAAADAAPPAEEEAAALRRQAPPGRALLGPAIARRISTRFALEPEGFGSLLVGAAAPEREASARALGRDAELAALRDAVSDVAAGRGRIVVVSGAAGVGKTRLVADVRAEADGLTWLEGHCLSYGGLVPQPFTEILLAWLAAEAGTPEIALRTKARARLGALLGDELEEVLATLDGLLGLGSDGGRITVADAYGRWLEALAAEAPVIVVLEDAHWADPTTQQLAASVFDLTDRAAVGVVVTEERDGGAASAGLRLLALDRHAHRTTEIALGPLADEAAADLVARLVGDDVDAAERDALVREAEGNPLYLEELARALGEGTLESRGRTWTISVRSPELLPPTLENLLVARIDRLAPGPRALAQTAAAAGRTFPVRVLANLAGDGAAGDLASLLRTEVVREVRRYPELECTFTHGLLQQAALATLTPAARRDLYARVAAAFEEVYADGLDEHSERLAHYHAQSGNLPRALEYAERARRRS